MTVKLMDRLFYFCLWQLLADAFKNYNAIFIILAGLSVYRVVNPLKLTRQHISNVSPSNDFPAACFSSVNHSLVGTMH